MSMKLKLLLFLCIAGLDVEAQQDALYSQYMFNPFAVNPAYAGSRSSYSAVFLYRYQWTNIPGAPKTGTFAIHAPATKMNLIWGLNAGVDAMGPQSCTNAAATLGYRINLKKSKLSFALRGGIISTNFNYGLLNFNDLNDPFDIGGQSQRVTRPSFDFGTYWYGKKFYLGLAVNHITTYKIAFTEDTMSGTSLPPLEGLKLRRHFFLGGGLVFDLKPNFVLKPSMLIKYADGSIPNVDLNVNALIYKRLWLGISARSSRSLVFLMDLNITDFLRIGYAFDYSLKLFSYTRGSHEWFLGFDFNLKKSNVVSPRYL